MRQGGECPEEGRRLGRGEKGRVAGHAVSGPSMSEAAHLRAVVSPSGHEGDP